MTKKICKNCKHWHGGKCTSGKLKYAGDVKTVTSVKHSDELVYWDSDMWRASIMVGKNFGCIHFEERDEKESSDTV